MFWLISITLSYCLGIFFSNHIKASNLWIVIVIFPLIFLLIYLKKYNKVFYGITAIILSLFIGIIWTQLRTPKPQNNDISKFITNKEIVLLGTIVDEPNIKKDRISIILNAKELIKPYKLKVSGKVIVSIRKDNKSSKLEYLQSVIVRGKLSLPSYSTPTFSYRDYLAKRGIFCQMNGTEVRILGIASTDFIYQLISIRNKIFNELQKYLSNDNATFIGSLIFGVKASPINEDIKGKFQKLGLSHILAASGFQVSLLLALCLGLNYFLNKDKLISKLLILSFSSFILISYLVMTAAPPSIQRASIMGFLTLIGLIINRQADPIACLIFGCLLLLIYNPLILYDIGLQMSFLATLGIIYTVPIVIEKLKFLTKLLISIIAVPLCAQAWVLPIQLYYFGQFSWLFLPANIVASIFVSILSYLGFIAGGIALIFAPLLKFLSPVIELILNIFINIIDLMADTPNSLLYTGHIPLFTVIISFLALFSITEWLKNNNSKLFSILSFLFLDILLVIYSLNFIPSNDLKITFFNLGKGSASLIITPGKKVILVDGGPSYKSYNAANKILIPYIQNLGINKIDAIIVTNFNNSYVGGLISVLKTFSIGSIYDYRFYTENKSYNSFLQEILKQNLKYCTVNRGNVIYVEPNINITFVYTDLQSNTKPLIFNLRYKDIKILFANNIGHQEELKLIQSTNIKCDILKLPKYVNKNSFSDEFLNAISPKYVVNFNNKNSFKDFNVINVDKDYINFVTNGNFIKEFF